MKYLLFLLLLGCSTTPVIVPDTAKPSVAAIILEANTKTGGDPSYMWVLWYIPICLIVLIWTWSYFIKKPK